MARDFRCECGHPMAGSHDENGCTACACEVKRVREGPAADAPQVQMAKAAKEQVDAFVAEGFSREEALALTKELVVVSGLGGNR